MTQESMRRAEEIKEQFPGEEFLFDAAELFKIFGDQTRIKILFALSRSELCVNEIADVIEMSVSAISHQLRILKQSRIVRGRRDGKTIYYRLADDHIMKMMDMAFEHISEE